MHVALILFFAWVLLHALIYSKSVRVIEGLEGNPTATQSQIDENTAEIAVLKSQLINLINTSNQLNAAMLANEQGVKQNTDLIQKVVQSQNDTNTKMANMKSTK